MPPTEILYQKGYSLSFPCSSCRQTVPLPLLELDERGGVVTCSHCQQNFSFSDPVLSRQLRKFEALCRQIHESEEILGHAAIGVDVGPHQVKIPFKLLLTRLNGHLDLLVGADRLTIAFRSEPTTLKE